jgi:hypothetical protein
VPLTDLSAGAYVLTAQDRHGQRVATARVVVVR